MTYWDKRCMELQKNFQDNPELLFQLVRALGRAEMMSDSLKELQNMSENTDELVMLIDLDSNIPGGGEICSHSQADELLKRECERHGLENVTCSSEISVNVFGEQISFWYDPDYLCFHDQVRYLSHYMILFTEDQGGTACNLDEKTLANYYLFYELNRSEFQMGVNSKPFILLRLADMNN